MAPTDLVPIIRLGQDGQRELVMARWGLVPFWMKDIPKKAFINARAETVATTPMFRDALAKRRCLIPATGFYEWQQRASGKQPYRIRRRPVSHVRCRCTRLLSTRSGSLEPSGDGER